MTQYSTSKNVGYFIVSYKATQGADRGVRRFALFSSAVDAFSFKDSLLPDATPLLEWCSYFEVHKKYLRQHVRKTSPKQLTTE